MSTKYSVIYYNSDQHDYSEIIGVYDDLTTAVIKLIKSAHYDEDKNGNLRQYLRKTDEYLSYKKLIEIVTKDMQLNDYDVYKIDTLKFL